jgi:TIM-barrel protein
MDKFIFKSPLALSAMAGINDGDFCAKASQLGASIVFLGGYNLDDKTLVAARQLVSRDRPEFIINLDEIEDYLRKEVGKISCAHVGINVRVASLDKFVDAINIVENSGAKIFELNVHCRQKEMVCAGAGEGLLKSNILFEMVKIFKKKTDLLLSIKFRNIALKDPLRFSRKLSKCGVDILHVDTMVKGQDRGNYKIISALRKCNVVLIGNNSVRDYSSAIGYLQAGANFVSIARCALNRLEIFSEITNKFSVLDLFSNNK